MASSEEQLAGTHIITVAGHIGSGKTEVCRKLREITGWEVVSAGAILRKMAVEHGMSVLEFNEYAKLHTSIDREIDSYIAGLGAQNASLIVDSRLAWHFLPGSIKVFLVVEPVVAAQRVFRATRPDESHLSIETAAIDNAERQRLERQRFMELYSLDCDYWPNYDFVVDTTHALPGETAAVLLRRILSKEARADKPECWLSPKRLLPTSAAADSGNAAGETHLDESTRIDVAVFRGACFILRGHAAVSAAIRAGRNLIGCRLMGFEAEPVGTAISLASINDWAAAHSFQFASYPEWLRTE